MEWMFMIKNHIFIFHQVWRLAFVVWIGAAVFSVPMIFLFRVTTIDDENSIFHNRTVCESIFRIRPIIERQIYSTLISIVHIFIPCIVISVCYIRIFLKISKKVEEAEGGKSKHNSGKIQLHSTQSTSLPKAKSKTLRMTVVVVSTFVICGLPYHILEMLYNFWHHEQIPKIAVSVLGALAVSNSVANPYIFLMFNTSSVMDSVCHGRQSEYHNDLKSTTAAHTARTILNTKHNSYNSTTIGLTPIHEKQNTIS